MVPPIRTLRPNSLRTAYVVTNPKIHSKVLAETAISTVSHSSEKQNKNHFMSASDYKQHLTCFTGTED